MSATRMRWGLIVVWMAAASVVFTSVGSWTERSWLLLFVAATIPPAMMLWFWNEDRPLMIGSLSARRKRQP